MVIRTNMDSTRTYNIYHRNSIALSNSMYKVSSGHRINTAADGASDLAIAEKMRTRNQSVEQADRNTQNGLNMVKTASGALSNINDTFRAVREKLVSFVNDTNGAAERGYIATEVSQLLSTIEDVATNTSYNGIKLLDGSWDATAGGENLKGEGNLYFQTGADGGDVTTVNIGSMMLADIDSVLSTELASLGENLATLAADEEGNAGNSTVSETVSEYIANIDSAIGYVLDTMTTLGATENKLGYISDNLVIESENLQASESTVRDLDVAKGMTEFAKNNILTQASQFMLAQANQNPYSVLNMLQQ